MGINVKNDKMLQSMMLYSTRGFSSSVLQSISVPTLRKVLSVEPARVLAI